MSWKVAMGSKKSWLTLGLYAVMLRMSTRYKITEQKINARYGMLSKESNTIDLNDIKDIQLSQSGMERILGYGDLAFSTAGTGGTEIEFQNVPKPGKLKNKIEDAKREVEIAQ